jgi:hypothetical protein
MASFGPNFDLLSTEQIDAKLEDLDRQQVVVEYSSELSLGTLRTSKF